MEQNIYAQLWHVVASFLQVQTLGLMTLLFMWNIASSLKARCLPNLSSLILFWISINQRTNASTFAFHPFLRPEWAVLVGCHFVTTCQSVVGGIWLSRFALKGLFANVYWTAWLFLLMLLFRSLALHKQSPSVNFVPFFSPYCSWYFV